MKGGLKSCALLAGALVLASCAFDYRLVDPAASAPQGGEDIQWRRYVSGIHLAEVSREDPPLRLYFARVDLTAPGLEVVTTPPNGEAPLETDGMRTTTFLRRADAALAINASQFRPVEQEEFAPKDVAGVAVFEGKQYSEDEGNQAVIAFHGDTAAIAEGLAQVEAHRADGVAPVGTAVAGRPIVLHEGRLRQFGPARHPRTAVGLDGAGETLFVLVAEGRMASRSIGLTLYEVGAWLRHLGAVDGLNLDGGGSSALVIRDGDGTPKRVNRTVHNPIFGSERVVANHLGFRVEE
jgi:hypothetical protein